MELLKNGAAHPAWLTHATGMYMFCLRMDGKQALHTMKVVCLRTGLTSHTVRVWERRYGVVTPVRTETNRRLYTDADIERLLLLHKATQSGHAIGQIVQLTNERLTELMRDDQASADRIIQPIGQHLASSPAGLMNACLNAVTRLDAKLLDEHLQQALVHLGNQGMLTRLAAPLSQRIGELWKSGDLTAAHEHFLTSALRSFLRTQTQHYSPPPSAPVLVVCTPAGQLHELGAVIVSAASRNLGWNVIYLGASLPAAEIAGAAAQQNARAVALSIVYPVDDPSLPTELANLRKLLNADVSILIGGRAARAYAPTISQIGAREIPRLEDLAPELDLIRWNSAKKRRPKSA